MYRSWAKRPPVEDRTGGARWVGGPWEEGVGGRLSRKFNLSRPFPVRSTCRSSVYSPASPSFLPRDPSSSKLFTVLLVRAEGKLIADRLPSFDSIETFETTVFVRYANKSARRSLTSRLTEFQTTSVKPTSTSSRSCANRACLSMTRMRVNLMNDYYYRTTDRRTRTKKDLLRYVVTVIDDA